MRVVYSPLHARHDGGVELHRGALVPSFESPARAQIILRGAAAAAATRCVPPRDMPESRCRACTTPSSSNSCAAPTRAGPRAAGTARCCRAAFRHAGCARDRRPVGHQRRDGLLHLRCEHADRRRHLGRRARRRALRHDCRGAGRRRRCRGLRACAVRRAITPGAAFYGGYCYLNNAALAAQHLRDHGCARVAVLDVDYHHGNGTQEIFWERDDVLFVSLHATPESEYPYFLGYADERGAGRGDGPHAQPAAAARHALAGIPRRARRRPRRDRALRAGCAGRVARRRYVRSGSDQRFQADLRGLRAIWATAWRRPVCRPSWSRRAAMRSPRSAPTWRACSRHSRTATL